MISWECPRCLFLISTLNNSIPRYLTSLVSPTNQEMRISSGSCTRHSLVTGRLATVGDLLGTLICGHFKIIDTHINKTRAPLQLKHSLCSYESCKPHLLPVETKLHKPLETHHIVAVALDQFVYHITRVNLNGHQSDYLSSLDGSQVASDSVRELRQHRDLFLFHALQTLLVSAVFYHTQRFCAVLSEK